MEKAQNKKEDTPLSQIPGLDAKSAEQLLPFLERLEEVVMSHHTNPEEWLTPELYQYSKEHEQEKIIFDWYMENKLRTAYFTTVYGYYQILLDELEHTSLKTDPTFIMLRKDIRTLKQDLEAAREKDTPRPSIEKIDTLVHTLSTLLVKNMGAPAKNEWEQKLDAMKRERFIQLKAWKSILDKEEGISEPFKKPLGISRKAIAHEIEGVEKHN